MENSDQVGELAERRRALLEDFDHPSDGDIVAWQRRLAAEHLAAERAQRAGMNSADQKIHRERLRLIGDNLAWMLLPRHTLRNLAGNLREPKPDLLGQVKSMEIVWEAALRLQESGFVPILADLTNLIRIGDIAAWRPEQTLVVECKSQPRIVK